MAQASQLPANFEFRSLQVFVATAEQGSMTAGAKVLGLTQSGVSQIIASLEEAVGSQLFDRTVRPILLTTAGQALYRHSEKIINDVNHAFSEASECERAEASSLSIALPESLASLLGPRLYRRRPDLARSWRFLNGLTPDQRIKFYAHNADIMVTEESSTSDMLDVARFSLYTEPYVMIFPKNYEGPTDLGPELADETFIRFSLQSSTGRQTEVQLNRLRLKFPSQIEFDSIVGHGLAVAYGMGWAITAPMCILAVPGLFDQVTVKPIQRGSFARRMTMVSREGALGSIPRAVAEEFRAIMRDEIFPELIGHLPWLKGSLRVGDY